MNIKQLEELIPESLISRLKPDGNLKACAKPVSNSIIIKSLRNSKLIYLLSEELNYDIFQVRY